VPAFSPTSIFRLLLSSYRFHRRRLPRIFGAATVAAGSTTSLTFTITNTAQGNAALTGVAFIDTLPTGLVVATPNAHRNVRKRHHHRDRRQRYGELGGGTLAAGGSCSFSVNVKGMFAGVQNNSVSVTSTEGGAGNTSNASVTVTLLPPVITKNFQSLTIQAGALSQVNLHFTINNPNPQDAFNPLTNRLTGIAFTDTLPGGLVVFTPNGLGGSCSGVTATAGSTSISMTGGVVGAGLTCTIDVTIARRGHARWPQAQRHEHGHVDRNGGGQLGFIGHHRDWSHGHPPLFQAIRDAEHCCRRHYYLDVHHHQYQSNRPDWRGVQRYAPCRGCCCHTQWCYRQLRIGTITATAGTGTVSLSGGTLAAGMQCQFAVNVTGTTSGTKNNTTGTITTNESAAGGTASSNPDGRGDYAADDREVVRCGVDSVERQHEPDVYLDQSECDGDADQRRLHRHATGRIGGSDTERPQRHVRQRHDHRRGWLGHGDVERHDERAGCDCTFSVNVSGTTAGVKNNSVTATSTEGGSSAQSNASVTVDAGVSPPTIAKSFGSAIVSPSGTTTLTFTLYQRQRGDHIDGRGLHRRIARRFGGVDAERSHRELRRRHDHSGCGVEQCCSVGRDAGAERAVHVQRECHGDRERRAEQRDERGDVQ
jgi:uncharacterized repeat protein (TIGR01451 family)